MTTPYLDTSRTEPRTGAAAGGTASTDGGRRRRRLENYVDESGPADTRRPYPDELYGHEFTERETEREPNPRDRDEWQDYKEHHEGDHVPPVIHPYQLDHARGDGGRHGNEGRRDRERGQSRQRTWHHAAPQRDESRRGARQRQHGGQQRRGKRGHEAQRRGNKASRRDRDQSGNRRSGDRRESSQHRTRQDQQRRNYQSGQATGDLTVERGAGGSGNRSPVDRGRGRQAVDDPYGGELIPEQTDQQRGGGQGLTGRSGRDERQRDEGRSEQRNPPGQRQQRQDQQRRNYRSGGDGTGTAPRAGLRGSRPARSGSDDGPERRS